MQKLYLVLISSLLLTACGGGSSDNDFTDNTTATHAKHLGTWTSLCSNYDDGTSSRSSVVFTTAEGHDVLSAATADFNTSGCIGTGTAIAVVGSPSYTGNTVTSICTADNFDMEIILALDEEETEYTGSNLQSFLFLNDINSEAYDIVCQYNGQLLLGNETSIYDSSSSVTRPIDMDVSTPYYQVSSRAVAKGVDNETSHLKQVMNNALTALQSVE